ncbi:hypothetical protein ACJIZ3_016114 [Penstemon smallii]|uniref:Remorin C-terminal domain-containing protein n=1 Tax=Penstemon smallii TaxID=265156 RepID=A0ABD3RSU5_9LAMI
MATAPPEDVIEKKAEVEEPPLAAVMAVDKPPHDDTKAVAKTAVPKSSKGSLDRDVAFAKLEDGKKLSFIKAWEENEKSKVDNKAQKKLSDVASWENTKKASYESELKKIEEQIEKKKANYAEKMRNKVALVHQQAQEKRAMVEANRGEDLLKIEESAAKHRATGHIPAKAFGCFGSYK